MLQHSHLVFDPLIRWKKDLSFEPRLATSWQRLDDTTIRFHLRKGVVFHSGRHLTAADVQFTVERLKKSPDFKAIFEVVKAVNIIDDYTFDLVTKTPYPLLINTATYIFPMDHEFYTGRDEIIKNGASFASRNSSGTGPYIVSERQQGVRVVYERFKKYWDTKSPGNVDTIILTPIAEDPTRVAALLSNDVDFIAPVPPADLQRIRASNSVHLISMNGTRIITFQLNQHSNPALANTKVRQAIVYAVNNAGIVKKIMRGDAGAAAQLSPIGYQGYNAHLKPRFNVAKAKQLMQEAGYADGFTVSMMAPNNRYVNDEKIAQAVAAMLAKIKIKVNLQTLPKAQYWPKFDERAADIMMIGWHSDTEDSANFFEFLAMCPNTKTGYGQYNSGNYCNPEVDELTTKANTETDTAKRQTMLQRVEQILYNAAAFVPLHWQNLTWAAQNNVAAEPVLNVLNFPYFGDLVIQ